MTDGLRAYRLAYLKEFWTLTKPRTEHIQDAHFDDKFDNNIQERLNGEFRDLEKVARGLKKDDSATIRGFRVHHNCAKPHMGLDGDTPTDRAGIVRGTEQVVDANTERGPESGRGETGRTCGSQYIKLVTCCAHSEETQGNR